MLTGQVADSFSIGPKGRVAAREGGRVDQEKVLATQVVPGGLKPGVHLRGGTRGDSRQRVVAHAGGDGLHLLVLAQRFGIDRADTAAGDDVVELVEADQFPGAA